MKKTNPWIKFREFLDALASDGTLNRSATVKALEEFTQSFPDSVDRDVFGGELAVTLAGVGNFESAVRLIRAVEYSLERAEYWIKLASVQLKVGDYDKAFDSLGYSQDAVNSLPADQLAERAGTLSQTASLLEQYGFKDRARETWNRAIETARRGQAENPDRSDCSAVLGDITAALAALGYRELAKSVADSIAIEGRRQHAREMIDRTRE